MTYTGGQVPTADELNNYTPNSVTLDAGTGTKIDLNDHPIENVQVIKFEQRTTAPSTPSEGWMYYNSTNNLMYYYNGSDWVIMGNNPLFWINTDSYTVYEEDWGSAGALSSNTDWDVTNTGTGAVTITATNYCGGQINECQVSVSGGGGTAQLTSKLIPSNRHIHVKFVVSHLAGTDGNDFVKLYVGNSTDGFTECYEWEPQGGSISGVGIEYWNTDFKVIALGSDNYDVYVGGKKCQSSVSLSNGCQIRIVCSAGTSTHVATCYIDDVYYSNWEVP